MRMLQFLVTPCRWATTAHLAVDAELLPREPEAEQAAEDAEAAFVIITTAGVSGLSNWVYQHQMNHQQPDRNNAISPWLCVMVLGLRRHPTDMPVGGIRSPAIRKSDTSPGCAGPVHR